MPSETHLCRVGGTGAILGAFVLLVATMLHPLDADPNDAAAAFAEYALDRYWVVTHLGQLFGVLLIVFGLIAFSWKLRNGRGGAWSLLAGVCAVASLSLAAALQAVDGVALKFMVDRLASAPPNLQASTFEAAFGVRQVEIGLASLMGLLFGLTVFLYGIAILFSAEQVNAWLGVLGTLAGAATAASSIVQAHTGFSMLAMAANMPSTMVLLVWVVWVGVLMLKRSSNKESE